MNCLIAMLTADFLERSRRSSFLVTVCLVIYLGYAVNAGTVLIKLGEYRGLHNSAWVGSLMAVVVTFFLGLGGFFLVKDTIQRDEQTGVGQILAATPITRAQYLLGKWLSNFLVLGSLVGILALAAVILQLLSREAPALDAWALFAPLLFLALPMMALTAAFAVFFETVTWLKGGFGNLVYFGLFIALLYAGTENLDVVGLNLVGAGMRAAAHAAFPDYDGKVVLSMVSDKPLQTFLWNGLDWTPGLIAQRLALAASAAGVALSGSLFFRRFENTRADHAAQPRRAWFRRKETEADALLEEESNLPESSFASTRLLPLAHGEQFHGNFGRLVRLETALLVKGLRWYWLAGAAAIGLGCVICPAPYRPFGLMLAAVWPVLVWAKMGAREARWNTGPLLYAAPRVVPRLTLSAWLSGVLVTALLLGGAPLGQMLAGETVQVGPWVLSVLFIPSLALVLGTWTGSSKPFQVIYPLLWYLGPMNPQNSLAELDYLGIHAMAPGSADPLAFAGVIALLVLAALLGRRRQAAPR